MALLTKMPAGLAFLGREWCAQVKLAGLWGRVTCRLAIVRSRIVLVGILTLGVASGPGISPSLSFLMVKIRIIKPTRQGWSEG